MNERIKELIEQATTYIEPTTNSGEGWIFDKEKFAELIVRECTTVINEIPRYAKTTNLKGYENACIADSIRAIEEHFGVE